jgi:hypothetical protein
MPIYHVRSSRESTRDFIVNAAGRDDATAQVLKTVEALNYNENASIPKTMRLLHTVTGATVNIADARQEDWTEATSKKKGK